ncbi:MAG: ATP-binding cassette domain-containing protein [Synechococcus sp.]|nr:ATP-binding cassette domain-containing protein [Synechococcus sp.]
MARPESSTITGAGAPYLQLERIEAWLGPRPVFHDLSLTLRLGEHVAVLGPNGSGKSTLVRLLTRQIYPVVRPGSQLRLFGRETVNLWELRRRIGLVSQDLHNDYNPAVPAADVILSGWFGSVGIGRHHQPSAAQRQRVQELLAEHDLAGLAERPFAELSTGQQRRLLLARALVHRPELLVLDEPLVGLDLRARHGLLVQLRRLAAGGTTLLLVTHQIEAIPPEIHRCILLRDGRVLADGPSDQLLRDAPLSALFATPLRVCQANGYRQVLPGEDPAQPASAAW